MANKRLSPEMIRWQSLIWSLTGPKDCGQRAVAQILFNFHVGSKTGAVFPSESLIAERAALSVRSVRRHLAALESGGWINRDAVRSGGKGWRRNLYAFQFPPWFDPDTDAFLRSLREKKEALPF
jgi:hypothetical protein